MYDIFLLSKGNKVGPLLSNKTYFTDLYVAIVNKSIRE